MTRYTIMKRKVYKKLIYNKLHWIEDICDNEWLGKIFGYTIGYTCFFSCFIPSAIISLFQLKSYINKIKYDIAKRPEYIKNWKHLRLVTEVEE